MTRIVDETNAKKATADVAFSSAMDLAGEARQ
jgi:hypothetical protein